MFFIKFTFKDAGAATRGVLQEKMFIEISQNSLENTCARVFLFDNVAGLSLQVC